MPVERRLAEAKFKNTPFELLESGSIIYHRIFASPAISTFNRTQAIVTRGLACKKGSTDKALHCFGNDSLHNDTEQHKLQSLGIYDIPQPREHQQCDARRLQCQLNDAGAGAPWPTLLTI